MKKPREPIPFAVRQAMMKGDTNKLREMQSHSVSKAASNKAARTRRQRMFNADVQAMSIERNEHIVPLDD